MITLGVDPGATTGLAIIEVAKSGKVTVMETHQLPVKETTLWLRREVYEGIDLIGWEKYLITPRTAKLSRQTDALELTGVIKSLLLYLITDEGIEIPLSIHTPADAKTVWSDERLKKHDLYKQATGHARDALRHALLAVERTNLRIL